MDQMDARMYPPEGTLPLHAIPHIQLPRKNTGILWLKAQNIYKKAVNAGKWQNFAAGIGTGATYACLHNLHWHPHWLTTIEYVRKV
jgi:hypothetical protein